jgi:V/A-type H+-transporting ATPase subunit I
LGVLHLEHVQLPVGASLDEARGRLLRLRRALQHLPRGAGLPQGGGDVADVVTEVERLIDERKHLDLRLAELRRERDRLAPLGDFDLAALRGLEARGLFVAVYRGRRGEPLPAVAGAAVEVLREDKDGTWFCVVADRDPMLPATPVNLGDRSPAEVANDVARAEARLSEIARRLAELGREAPRLQRAAAAAHDAQAVLEARAGMGQAEPVVYLRGYCPERALPALERAAAASGWGLLVEEPGPEDATPTLIENPAWSRPIETVFHAIGILPGYREYDISKPFLLFLSIFFAMLVGDAGYGVLFLLGTWLVRRKFRDAPAEPFRLVALMGCATVVWGVLTGTYFGMASIPPLLEELRVAWLTEPHNVMLVCFAIGAAHLTLAHAWCGLQLINTPQALAQVGWICTTWTMFFAARSMVLGAPFPAFVPWLLGAGIVLILVFMTPARALKSEWFNHVMLPLSLVSNFVDVVSYLRLFAVGTAGYAVAAAFNRMAADVGHGVLGSALAAFILFLGHGLNVLLAAMGVLVHGVRLNTLEFSAHIGLQWTGIPYSPFRSQALTAGGGSHQED